MRRLCCLVWIFLLVVFLPSALADNEETFTLMIYLCGTDLETDGESATSDLMEMAQAHLPEDSPVTVVIETGGTKEWWVDGIDPERSQRWVVIEEDIFRISDMPRSNMGDAQTLEDFIVYSIESFPADRYGLILWNHGGGSTTGVCFDELTDDYLTAEEIHTALQGGRQAEEDFQLSFIGFDACLMASFEMANYVRDFADYMIASEELMPANGFDYEALLGALRDDPGIDIPALGRIVVDSFVEDGLRNDPDDYMTLSVLDMSKMQALTEALEALGKNLSFALESGELSAISRNRQNMRSFGDYNSAASDMVDLLHFAKAYAALVSEDISALEGALEEVVIYNRYTENNLDDISGMSILVPLKTREQYPDYRYAYDPLALFPHYTAFVEGFTGMMLSGNYAFVKATPSVSPGWGIPAQLGENVTASGWQAAGGTQEYPEEPQTAPPDEEGIFSFSLTLTAGDMENLAYVEGNLMIDVSDEDTEAYIDLGYLQHTLIDWDNNTVYSLFDGSWPTLQGQAVYMSDQIITEKTRRSLIDAQVNDLDVYLLVLFDEDRPNGEVIGYTEGYSANGSPVRGYQKLEPGDVIYPQYYLYSYDEDGEETIRPFRGQPIVYAGDALSFGYESLDSDGIDFVYTFCLNDIFGDYAFSDFIFFTM